MSIKFKYITKNKQRQMNELKRIQYYSSDAYILEKLRYFGEKGVANLTKNTPIDTGLLANSWEYSIERTTNGLLLTWYTTDMENGLNVAIILDQGHATKSGGWVEGRNFIYPSLQPIYDEVNEWLRKEILNK